MCFGVNYEMGTFLEFLGRRHVVDHPKLTSPVNSCEDSLPTSLRTDDVLQKISSDEICCAELSLQGKKASRATNFQRTLSERASERTNNNKEVHQKLQPLCSHFALL